MFAASVKGGGQMLATPDVCKIPPLAIPTPFPNTGLCANAIGGTSSAKVKITNLDALHLSTIIGSTMGDEAGSLLGVTSGTVSGPAQYTAGSSAVMIEGNPAVMHLKPTKQNGMAANAFGTQVSPSQGKVFIGK